MASHVTEMHIPVKTTRLFFQLTIFMSFIAGFASTASPTPAPTQAAWVKVFRDVFGGPVGSGNAALSCGNFYHGGSEEYLECVVGEVDGKAILYSDKYLQC